MKPQTSRGGKLGLTETGELIMSQNHSILELEVALVSMCYSFITDKETESQRGSACAGTQLISGILHFNFVKFLFYFHLFLVRITF